MSGQRRMRFSRDDAEIIGRFSFVRVISEIDFGTAIAAARNRSSAIEALRLWLDLFRPFLDATSKALLIGREAVTFCILRTHTSDLSCTTVSNRGVQRVAKALYHNMSSPSV